MQPETAIKLIYDSDLQQRKFVFSSKASRNLSVQDLADNFFENSCPRYLRHLKSIISYNDSLERIVLNAARELHNGKGTAMMPALKAA